MNKSTRQSSEVLDVVTRSHERVSGVVLPELYINILIKLNYALLMDLMGKNLAPHALSPVSYITMVRLYSNSNNLANPSELSQFTGETRTNMTRICDDLVSRGLMHRVASADDRRRIDLSLTDAGIELLHTVIPALRKKSAVVYSVFSEQEKELFASLLTKLNHSLEANS